MVLTRKTVQDQAPLIAAVIQTIAKIKKKLRHRRHIDFCFTLSFDKSGIYIHISIVYYIIV